MILYGTRHRYLGECPKTYSADCQQELVYYKIFILDAYEGSIKE